MNDKQEFGGEIVWSPTPDQIEKTHLARFMDLHNIHNFEALMVRSTTDVPWFTDAVLNFLDIRFHVPYDQVADLSKGPQWPQWCVNGRMNIVSNCLDKYQGTETEKRTAFIWEGEEGQTQAVSYQALYHQVNQASNALRSLGLGMGSPIAIYMPMIPEIIVALLAVAKIGGVILPLFSGYGPTAVITRLQDAGVEAILTADGFQRRGKSVLMKETADLAAEAVATVKHMLVVDRIGAEVSMQPGRDHWWDDLVDGQSSESKTADTAAEDHLMLIYTSGTTGRPKGAVHTHCGFPVKAAQDMAFGTDVHPDDVIYWMTDMGWMMGPWLVFGALLLGSTFLIYDGSPDFPGPDRLWDMVSRHQVSQLGISPTLIRALIPQGDEHFNTKDLSTLRYFASTGEPWNPEPWMWLFEKVGRSRVPIINYSGGTEISGGILMGNPILPVKPTAFSGPCPGMAADIFNDAGESVRGQVGELVIKAPWIGMTRGFWNDPDRYLETYWARWDGVWVHGDFAAVDQDDMWYILGRSDDTIKIAGKRLGPAEAESIAVEHPQVVEAAAIGVPHEIKGSDLVLFCVLAGDAPPPPRLAEELQEKLSQALGKPLRPKKVIFIRDLPKTRNAKVMRRMARAAYLDLDPGDTTSLVNPEALEEIKQAK